MTLSRPAHADVPVMLRRDLLGHGWTDRAVSAMLRSAEWTRVRHGAYTPTVPWRQLDDVGRHAVRTRAVLAAGRTPLVVSHASAAVLHGAPTWGLALDDVHVTRTDGRIGRHEAGVHQHGGALADGDVVLVHDVPVTSATRTALEVCTVASVEAAVSVVSHLLRVGATTSDLLRERYADTEHSMTQWPHSRATDLVLRISRPEFESVGECRTFMMIWHGLLPLPVPQHEVRDEDGLVLARLDFAWPELGVWLEFDGKVKYEKLLKPGERASDVVVREKKREELVARLTGWRCIRLTWADLENPERTIAMLRRILGERARMAG